VAPTFYPLLGLDAALTDPGCERVECHLAANDSLDAFDREAEDLWARADGESEPLHGRDLRALIQNGFGQAYDRVVCFLGAEKIEYAVERGAVRTRRVPRGQTPADVEGEAASLEPVADALGIPRSKRKAKLRQARQFAGIVERALEKTAAKELRILDLACGRSYLGFVLLHLLAARGRGVTLHGVDSEPTLVAKCREIAQTLGRTDTAFEVADLAGYSIEAEQFDLAVSLHGCDTLTDEAIRIACGARVPLVFVAPCCQHELRHQWKRHPLEWVARYGLLEQRLADVLTDGFRCLAMEALGYQVQALRFSEPETTPKNLLIQGRLTSAPRPARAREAAAFVRQFGVWPRLAEFLKAAGLLRGDDGPASPERPPP